MRVVGLRSARCGGGFVSQRCQQLAPVPERKTKLLEVRVCQLGKNVEVDIVLSQHGAVLAEAERLEPSCQLFDG